jgi:uncharacterized membrane protein
VAKRVLFPLLAFAAASAWCVALLVVRKHEFGAAGYPFLIWNLTLAWIPLALSGLMVAAYRRRRSRVELAAIGVVWLLFLPNAPYILTDFVNMEHAHPLFDALVIGSFAVTALALGFASLLLVQLVVTRVGGALAGWAVAVVSLFAASAGVYLGRVLRFNSWDVVQRPRSLLAVAHARLDDPLGNRYLLGYVLLLGGFLTLAYAGLYGASALGTMLRRDPGRTR